MVACCKQENAPVQDSKSLILSRLKELEQETGEPEKRDILRRRKKQLKDIQAFLQDKAKTLEEKLDFLQQKLLSQVILQGFCHLHASTSFARF